jgi:hypothetical protein
MSTRCSYGTRIPNALRSTHEMSRRDILQRISIYRTFNLTLSVPRETLNAVQYHILFFGNYLKRH